MHSREETGKDGKASRAALVVRQQAQEVAHMARWIAERREIAVPQSLKSLKFESLKFVKV